uniref:Uncharacterized protein n=1 Tax=Bursaphelenchus xylophilus TaxID=6326 RepID=A0A1I7SRP6_BURXY
MVAFKERRDFPKAFFLSRHSKLEKYLEEFNIEIDNEDESSESQGEIRHSEEGERYAEFGEFRGKLKPKGVKGLSYEGIDDFSRALLVNVVTREAVPRRPVTRSATENTGAVLRERTESSVDYLEGEASFRNYGVSIRTPKAFVALDAFLVKYKEEWLKSLAGTPDFTPDSHVWPC